MTTMMMIVLFTVNIENNANVNVVSVCCLRHLQML